MRKQTFEEWYAEVDQWVVRKCGLSRDDLPDWNYRDAYEDGVQAHHAAAKAIRAAKQDMGL